jgi:hypothetical protein
LLRPVAAVAAAALLPTLTGPGYLAGVADHADRMAASALVYLVAAGTSVGIAVALYPLLKKTHAALAEAQPQRQRKEIRERHVNQAPQIRQDTDTPRP